ncbi:hypothetical protein Tco_0845248 [Tanacetum coccineum]
MVRLRSSSSPYSTPRGRDEKKRLDHLEQDLRMLVINRFRERKKIFRDRKLSVNFVQRVMSIYDFLCMPSLDKVTIQEEPHGLDTSILGRVADRTTSPALTASTRPEISTKAAKETISSKKGSGAGSSGQAAGDEVEQADDCTLDDDDQHDDSEFVTEGIKSLNDVSQGEHINVIPLRTFDLSIGLDMAEQKLSSCDKKNKKYRNKRDTLAMEKAKIEEELVGTKSQLEHRERQAEEI